MLSLKISLIIFILSFILLFENKQVFSQSKFDRPGQLPRDITGDSSTEAQEEQKKKMLTYLLIAVFVILLGVILIATAIAIFYVITRKKKKIHRTEENRSVNIPYAGKGNAAKGQLNDTTSVFSKVSTIVTVNSETGLPVKEKPKGKK